EWSPDGRFLIYMAGSEDSKSQLLYRERRADGSLGEAVAFFKTAFNERWPRFAPDGRYVVYVSDESGRNEIYVRDFPKAAKKWQIPSNGGVMPRWRRDGGEVFYQERRGIASAAVAPQPAFLPSAPIVLFGRPSMQPGFDVSSDGKRFVILERPA